MKFGHFSKALLLIWKRLCPKCGVYKNDRSITISSMIVYICHCNHFKHDSINLSFQKLNSQSKDEYKDSKIQAFGYREFESVCKRQGK